MSVPITEYRNAKVMNADGTIITVEINTPDHGWVPYTLDTSDTDMTIDNSALLTLIGDDKEAYVAPTPEEAAATLAAQVRNDRNIRLSEVDLVLSNPLRWAAMSDEEKAPWVTYRQALLDVPQQSGFPNSVTWPSPPEGF